MWPILILRRGASRFFPNQGLPTFFGGSVADGFLSETDFAEFCAEAVHLWSFQMVLGEKALFEKEELVFGSIGVVDDGNE